jgi:hypothetical protein
MIPLQSSAICGMAGLIVKSPLNVQKAAKHARPDAALAKT